MKIIMIVKIEWIKLSEEFIFKNRRNIICDTWIGRITWNNLFLMVILSKLTISECIFVKLLIYNSSLNLKIRVRKYRLFSRSITPKSGRWELWQKSHFLKDFICLLPSLEVTMKLYNWFLHYTSWLEIYGREIAKSDIIFNCKEKMTES